MEFYLKLNGEQVGPYRLEDIQGWLNAGYINSKDSAWYQGCSDWIKIEDIPGININFDGHLVRTDLVLPFEAYSGNEPYIFVCYAHKDSNLVYQEIKELHNAGFRIWYDEGIGVSSEWPEEIARAVLGCSIFLVFISPEATASVNCRNEINLALDEDKAFVSVYLKESKLPPGLRLRMGDLQAIYRFKLTKDQYVKKLHKTLNYFFDNGNILDAEIENDTYSTKSKSKTKKSLKYALLVCIILVFAMGSFLLKDILKEDEIKEPEVKLDNFSFEKFRTVSPLGLEMIWCPPGSFQMGSSKNEVGRKENETLHTATISKGFYLGKYEVTQAQWEKVMGSNPSFFIGTNRPVERVSWEQAKSFCEKLTQIDREKGILPDGWKYDLPTETEWEYACRAGSETRFAWGETIDQTLANYKSDINSTQEIGFYISNTWGFFDMHGNVYEWVFDKIGNYSNTPVVDTKGSKKGYNRVLRGGSWFNNENELRSADRASALPGISATFIGFRLALKQSVEDIVPPELKLIGGENIVHEGGKEWLDPGIEVRDYRDGNLSAEVRINGNVDVFNLGSYEITYMVSDYSGNENNLTRVVEVKDSIPPEIILIGDQNITVEAGASWFDPGVSASDEMDGRLNEQINVHGSIDLNSIGNYSLIYSVVDSSDNKSSVKRNIQVVSRSLSTEDVPKQVGIEIESEEDKFESEEIISFESEELLDAVKNWKSVPDSVFPLNGVEVNNDVILEIYDSSGNVMASKEVLKGSPLVAISLDGDVLIVSLTENSKLIGKVELSKTNFKQKVAQLFEVRKKQRELNELLEP